LKSTGRKRTKRKVLDQVTTKRPLLRAQTKGRGGSPLKGGRTQGFLGTCAIDDRKKEEEKSY